MLIEFKSIANFSSIGNANILELMSKSQCKGTLKNILDLNEAFIGIFGKQMSIETFSWWLFSLELIDKESQNLCTLLFSYHYLIDLLLCLIKEILRKELGY